MEREAIVEAQTGSMLHRKMFEIVLTEAQFPACLMNRDYKTPYKPRL